MANWVHNNILISVNVVEEDSISAWEPMYKEAYQLSLDNPNDIITLQHASVENNCHGYCKYRNGELLVEKDSLIFSEKGNEKYELIEDILKVKPVFTDSSVKPIRVFTPAKNKEECE